MSKDAESAPRRPAAITGWVILFGIYTAASAFRAAQDIRAPWALLILAGGTVLAALLLVGVWRMRRWARLPAMGLIVLLMVLLAAGLLRGSPPAAFPADPEDTLISEAQVLALGWLALNALALGWLARHGAAFG